MDRLECLRRPDQHRGWRPGRQSRRGAQKELFASFYQQYNASRPLFQKAEATLLKIVHLNEGIASTSVEQGRAAVVKAESAMVIAALVAALVEEAAAAASLENQAARLAQVVSVFRLDAVAPARARLAY